MAKRFNGVVKYSALFVIVFLIALLFFALIFGIIFPSKALAEGPVSPYYSARRAESVGEAAAAPDQEFSRLISVFDRMTASEKMKLYSLFSSKLTETEIEEFVAMASDGVSDDERAYFNALAAERLTASELGEIGEIYEKYA